MIPLGNPQVTARICIMKPTAQDMDAAAGDLHHEEDGVDP
jgi:hypothetical protein